MEHRLTDPVQRHFATTGGQSDSAAASSGQPLATCLRPEDGFPIDLSAVSVDELHVFYSKVRRQLDREYLGGGPHPETYGRHADLTEELDAREASAG